MFLNNLKKINSINFNKEDERPIIVEILTMCYFTLGLLLNIFIYFFSENGNFILIFNAIFIFILFFSKIIFKNVALYLFRSFILLFVFIYLFLFNAVAISKLFLSSNFILFSLFFVIMYVVMDCFNLKRNENYSKIKKIIESSFRNGGFSEKTKEKGRQNLKIKSNLLRRILFLFRFPLFLLAFVFGKTLPYFTTVIGRINLDVTAVLASFVSLLVFLFFITYVNLFFIFFILFIRKSLNKI